MKLAQFEAEFKPAAPTSYPTHREGCRCLRCVEDGRVPNVVISGPHRPGCNCGGCRSKPQEPFQCPACKIYYFTAGLCPNGCDSTVLKLPKEVHCYIRHTAGKACDCTAPQIVNEGMLQATESAALYMLSAMKTEAKPRSGLTRDDLDFLAMTTAKMAAHWARRALGQQDLL